MRLPRQEVLIIATGGQGEQRAALARIAFGQHELKITEGDTVIFSSKIIPGNEMAIGRIMNALSDAGVIVVTDRQVHIHVSGHPGRPELAEMYRWIRPQIVVPVHGEARHMAEQARFALKQGVPQAIYQKNGDVIRLAPDGPEKIGDERTGRLVLDGDVILPADGSTVNERRKISINGLIAVAVPVDGRGALAGDIVIRPVRRAHRAGSRRLHRRCNRRCPACLQRGCGGREGARGRAPCRTPLRNAVDGQEADRRGDAGQGRKMKPGSILAIYFLFWVTSAFFLLPFGVRTDEEMGTRRCRGKLDSAPHKFDIPSHVLRATVLATASSASITPTGISDGSPRRSRLL